MIALFLRHGMEERGLTAATLNDVAASAISDLFRYDKVSPTLDPLVRATKKVIGRLAKKGPGGKLPLPRRLLEDFVAMVDPRSLRRSRCIPVHYDVRGHAQRVGSSCLEDGTRLGRGRKFIYICGKVQIGPRLTRGDNRAGRLPNIAPMPSIMV